MLICGHQPELLRQAVAFGVGCVILCQAELPDDIREMAKGTCIISTPYDSYRTVRRIFQAIPVSRIAQREYLQFFRLEDYIDDVREVVLQSRYRSYPILDADGRVVGTLSRYHLIRPRRKQVVLVDHNEAAQSVPGLEQADILAIIDHHRLADIQTKNPIYVRNEPVGSTTTIVAGMYQERGLMPSAKLAGLMAAAIVSDTVMFKSPTCTPRDRRMAERMAHIAGISLDELGQEIFSASAPEDKPVEELLFRRLQGVPYRRPRLWHQPDHLRGLRPSAQAEGPVPGPYGQNQGGARLQHDDPHAHPTCCWRAARSCAWGVRTPSARPSTWR